MSNDNFMALVRVYGTKKEYSLDHYRRATGVSLLLGGVLLGCYIFSGETAELIFPELTRTLITIFGFDGHLISSSTYIARSIDLAENHKRPGEYVELVLTTIGVIVGLAVGITLSILKGTTKTIIGIIQAGIFTMRAIGAFAGITNRLSSLYRRPSIEKTALLAATVIGLGLGILLFCTSSIPIISIAGVNVFFAGNSALPTAISFVIAVGYITSCYESAADYGSKALLFLYKEYITDSLSNDKSEDKHVRTRFYEYKGSFIMALAGLTVSLFIIPHLIIGFTSLATAATVLAVCLNIFGGIGSRLGRLVDAKYEITYEKSDTAAEKSKERRPSLTTQSSVLTTLAKQPSPSPSQPPPHIITFDPWTERSRLDTSADALIERHKTKARIDDRKNRPFRVYSEHQLLPRSP